MAYLNNPVNQRVRTNNHVERANRTIRMLEKVRYKWRRRKTWSGSWSCGWIRSGATGSGPRPAEVEIRSHVEGDRPGQSGDRGKRPRRVA